jgi:hypothetical protein
MSQRIIERVWRIPVIAQEAGLWYLGLYVSRWATQLAIRNMSAAHDHGARQLQGVLQRIDNRLIAIERQRRIAEPWALCAKRFTVSDNRQWWNSHDWSQAGEEWTPSADWKRSIVDRYLAPYMPEGGAIIEIGNRDLVIW